MEFSHSQNKGKSMLKIWSKIAKKKNSTSKKNKFDIRIIHAIVFLI